MMKIVIKGGNNFIAQAFPIRTELKDSIAGSMSFNAFRKYLTNAQVTIQLGLSKLFLFCLV